MERERVSIIVPCYNGEKYLPVSMESILAQTYPLIDLIFVDDGSEDQTAERMKEYEEKFQKRGYGYCYLHQPHGGVGAALNLGLLQVQGEYLSLLDADDRLMSDSIRKKAELLRAHPECGVVRSNGCYVSADQRERRFFTEQDEEEDLYEALLLGKTYNWSGSYLVRTEILFQAYPDRQVIPSAYGQNLQLLLPAAKWTKSLFLDEPLMEYIQWKESLTRRGQTYEEQIQMYREFQKIREDWVEAFEERTGWKEKIRICYLHQYLKLAYQFQEREQARYFYGQLKEKGELTREDKIYYGLLRKGMVRFGICCYLKISGVRG